MYIAIKRHTARAGKTNGQVSYWFHLSDTQDGAVYARSAKFQTMESCQRTAQLLFSGQLVWTPETPPQYSYRCDAWVACTAARMPQVEPPAPPPGDSSSQGPAEPLETSSSLGDIVGEWKGSL